jgi:hypothetical protein
MTRKIFPEVDERMRLPQPPAPGITPAGFVMCCLQAFPGQSPELWFFQQRIYQQAFENAQAVVSPSILERDLLGYWN